MNTLSWQSRWMLKPVFMKSWQEGTLAQQQLEFDHRLNELQAQLNGSSGLHPRPGNDRR